MIDIDALKRDKRPQSSITVHALIDRLEAAEKERDALRAKIEQMEQQEPVGWLLDGGFYEVRQMSLYKDNEPLPGQTALYALPGAKGERVKPLVIYHANCTDGFGAAFAAWLKLGDEAEYRACHYNQECFQAGETVHNREVYILDFSFPRDVMDWLFRDAKRVVWLDHHKTAFEMWLGSMPQHGQYVIGTGHTIWLDNNKSGAMLAWEYFHPGTEVPMPIRHIDDRADVLKGMISELFDRLEAAEKERDKLKELNIAWCKHSDSQLIHNARLAAENYDLRAKIAEMEQQRPVGKFTQHPSNGLWEQDGYGDNPEARPLYALPGAQNVPKAVAHLDLGTGGYMDIGTDLTDEALAALPKGRHMLGIVGTYGVDGYVPAQPAPSVPDGWLRAIDEALVTAHIGVANAHDTYEQAKAKLDNLIGFHVDVATDPAVNGGFKLMPDGWEADLLIVEHAMRMNNWDWNSNTSDDLKRSAYKIISKLLAAPEAKP